MEKNDCDFNHEPYRRVPMNSATTQLEWMEYNSIGTFSANSNWSKSRNQPMTTTYIDGTTILGQYDRPYSIRDSFPKGKARQKPPHSSERKDPQHALLSVISSDQLTARSDKSLVSVITGRPSHPPEVLQKSTNQFQASTIIFDDDSQSKFYTRCATNSANGGWIRRYKSINRSQILGDILRDQSYDKKNLLKKRSYQQLLLSSSSSIKSLNKRRREHS